MTRARELGPPPERLGGFPRRTLRAGVELFRIHGAGRDPRWFSSDGSGRFDLPEPDGTCYLAAEPLGAFVEVFGDVALVDEADVRAKQLSVVSLSSDVVLADCASTRALAFGVDASVHSASNYARTQEWAVAFHAASFDGVRYLVRHDPSQRLVGVALFGPAGESPSTGPVSTERIGSSLVRNAERRFGIRVVPAP